MILTPKDRSLVRDLVRIALQDIDRAALTVANRPRGSSTNMLTTLHDYRERGNELLTRLESSTRLERVA